MNAIKRFNAGAVIVFPKSQLLVQKTHHKTCRSLRSLHLFFAVHSFTQHPKSYAL